MKRLSTLFALVSALSLVDGAGCDDPSGDPTDSAQGGSGGTGGPGGGGGSAACCTADTECGPGRCVGGTCVELTAGQCFVASDCGTDETCEKATVCGCNQVCVAGTVPGTCTKAKAPGCPASASAAGLSCDKPDLRCSYADSEGCAVTLQCVDHSSGATWASVAPDGGSACSTPGKVCTYDLPASAPSKVEATCEASGWKLIKRCQGSCQVDCVCPEGTTCQRPEQQNSYFCL